MVFWELRRGGNRYLGNGIACFPWHHVTMGVIWWRETDRNVGLDYLPWWFSRCLYVRMYLENRKSLSSAYQIWENSINRNRSPKVLHNVVKATMDNSCFTTLLHFLSKETYSMKIGCGSNKKKRKMKILLQSSVSFTVSFVTYPKVWFVTCDESVMCPKAKYI